MYGRYTVTATGWINDAFGRRYRGGGTYHFWIAKRMTLATATFQGQPYPVGSTYGRDTQFNPAVPADVTVTASLYPDSSAALVRTVTYAGKATAAGLFGAAQGMKSFPLDAPGEYHASLLATYTDGEGHLWVSTMRHAGVVYPEPSGVVARQEAPGGNEIRRSRRHQFRRPPRSERRGPPPPHHVPLSRRRRAAHGRRRVRHEQDRARAHVPECRATRPRGTRTSTTWAVRTCASRPRTGTRRTSIPSTSRRWRYYYGAAPRPGFMGRFLVGESTVRAPYWSLSPNSFGGQNRRVAERRCAGRHLSPARRRGAAPARPGPAVLGLHFERVHAAQGHEQQPRGRPRVRRPQRAPR